MAGSSVIGALRVVLGADTAAFEDGLKAAQGKAGSFASGVAKIMAGIGLEHGLEKAVEAIVHSFKEAIKHADDMGKAAQKLGLPVEELTKLKFAADLSDVSMEALSTGLGKLSKNMLEVARGGGDAAALAFKDLGISVKQSDGSLKSVSSVLVEVAGKFGSATDGAAKTGMAMALLGKGGKDLIPLLNEGKDGLIEMMKAAESMGLVISTKTAAQSQVFNDNIKLLHLASQGLTNMVLAGVLPAMVRLSEQWVKTAKDGETMRFAAAQIVTWIKELVIVGAQGIALNELLGKSFIELQEAVTSFPNIEKSRDAVERLREIWSSIGPRLEGLRVTVGGLFEDVESHAKKVTDLKFDAALGKAIEELQFKTRVLKGDFDKLALGFPELAKGLGLFGMTVKENRVSAELLTPALQKLNEAQLVFKGAQLTEDSLLPWQTYEKQLERINQLFNNGAISQETYSQAIKNAADKANTSWSLAGAQIADSFATIAGSFGESNSKMATAAKAFAIVSAIISAFEGASKALTLPFPANLAAAAVVLAKGFAFVAAIKSQAVPKFAKGGSFVVPGGISGTDNMMVPLNLASGERVDITPANQASGSGRGGGGDRVLTIDIKAKSFFGQHMRDLAEAMIEAQRDGYTFQLKAA